MGGVAANRSNGLRNVRDRLINPTIPDREIVMIPRTWDADTLVRSIPWLRRENRNNRNIFCRPKGEHNLSMIDDLSSTAVRDLKKDGFEPALVVETSPQNFQVWLKHEKPLPAELSTAVAKALAARFGGDTGAADWRHFGRLAGFTIPLTPISRNPQSPFS